MRTQLISTVALVVITASWFISEPDTRVSFLDVGQGDSTLIQSGTRQVLIDGGPGDVVLQRLAEEMPWFDRTIEVMILTHPQKDHLEGLLHVLDRYRVSLVLLPQAASSSQLQAAWLAELQARHIPYRFSWAGQSLASEGIELSVLGPIDSMAAQAATARDVNNASTLVRADVCPAAGCLSALFTGDAGAAVERLLLQSTDSNQLEVDILKAGHHGSKTSTTGELLTASSPAAVVVSAGKDNRFGHPHELVMKRIKTAGAMVFRTDEQSTIRLIYTPTGWVHGVNRKRPVSSRNKEAHLDNSQEVVYNRTIKLK